MFMKSKRAFLWARGASCYVCSLGFYNFISWYLLVPSPPSHPFTGCGLEEKTANSCQGGEVIFQNELLILQEIGNLFESILKLHSNCKTFYLNESLLRRATKTCKGTRQLEEQQMSSPIRLDEKHTCLMLFQFLILALLQNASLIHNIFLKFRIRVNFKN